MTLTKKPMQPTRADRNMNPAAFTTEIALSAGLVAGQDFVLGDPFTEHIVNEAPKTYYTARLLKDPILTTIQVIDAIGFQTKHGGQRWVYINMPKFVWDSLSDHLKAQVVLYMYKHEGGTEMMHLFE